MADRRSARTRWRGARRGRRARGGERGVERRGRLRRIASVALGLAALAAEAAAEEAPSRPNVLLVTFDTTRADRLGCYGFAGARTKNIDRLAAEGVLFTRAYCQAVQTLPSHAALLSGLFPITLNVVSNGQRVPDEVVTLAEILHGVGYRTGAVVATAPLDAAFGLDQGFETYDDDFGENPLAEAFRSFFRIVSFNKANLRAHRPAHRVARAARRWLRRAARDERSFFLWVHFIDPHHPYVFRPDFRRPRVEVSGGPLNAYGQPERNYVNEIEFADFYLGTVLDELDALGLTETTLTVLAADHGESLGEHGYRGHREEVYESIVRVPLILRWPGRLPAGERRDAPAMLVDVVPTILRLAGLPYRSDSFQGRDLLSLEEGASRPVYAIASELFTRSLMRIAMIEGRWKYVLIDDGADAALYDLLEDPHEEIDLLEADGPVTTARDWEGELRAWVETHDRLEPDDFRMSEELRRRLESLGYVR